MQYSLKTKHLIMGVIIAAASVLCTLPYGALLPILVLTAQAGCYSVLLSAKFAWWHPLVPMASFGAAYLASNSLLLSAIAVSYVPVAVIIGICLRKGANRGVTVVLSSVGIGVTAVAYVVISALAYGITFNVSDISSYITALSDYFANQTIASVPDSFFTESITREMYLAMLLKEFKYYSFSFLVLCCNLIAFASTAIARRVINLYGTTNAKLTTMVKDWLFVLSKPSAAMYLVCYLCLLIGGETLTTPQQIAFNTVMVAIQGGLLVMAFRNIREKMRVAGFSALIIYIILFYFFSLEGLAIVLSVSGLFAAFRQKTKEDKE